MRPVGGVRRGHQLLWLHGYRLPPIWAALVLGAVAALAERQSVAVTNGTDQISVSFLPLVFSAVVFGPLGGFAVGALSTVLDLRESPLKWSVYTPIRGLTAAAAGLAAGQLVPHPDELRRIPSREPCRFGCRPSCGVGSGWSDRLGAQDECPGGPARHQLGLATHSPALCACPGALRLRLPPLLPVARPRLLPSSPRCSASPAPLPARKGRDQGPRGGERAATPARAFPSQLRWLRRSMPETSTRPATPPP